MPKAFKEPLLPRGILVSLRVLDLELLEIITDALLQSLGESTEGNERGELSPDGHVIAHGGQVIR